jgi:hypothetical protein
MSDDLRGCGERLRLPQRYCGPHLHHIKVGILVTDQEGMLPMYDDFTEAESSTLDTYVLEN